MARRFGLVAAFLVFAFSGVSPAAAAPQALGLIARADPVTLQCQGGECGAEFTAFCVERYRNSPEPGTAYYLHDPATVAVNGLRHDGTTVRIDVASQLTVITERGHSAVRLSLPESVLGTFDLASVAVTVLRKATLLPVPVPGDPYPQTAVDIMLSAGPLRTASSVVIDNGGERIDAAWVTSNLINALPRHGRASQARRESVWQEAAPEPGAPGYLLARAGFERCGRNTMSGLMSLRQCLGSMHDAFVGELNTRYWQVMEIGS